MSHPPPPPSDLVRVDRFDEFDRKFRAFCRNAFGAFTKSDWNNVVVAGGAVLSSLKPGPDEMLPQSDVDVFLWGLNEADAKSKIQDVQNAIARSIENQYVFKVEAVRTPYTITLTTPTRLVSLVDSSSLPLPPPPHTIHLS